jgi:iron(III) transport system permease protein
MSVADRLAAPLDGDRPTGLTLLGGAIAAAVLSPLLWILLRVLQVDQSYALSILARPTTVEILLNSLGLVAAVTGASILLGVPLAFLTVRTDLPFRRFWTIAVALPLVIPSYLGAFTFISAFGPSGQLADVLAPLGIGIPTIYGFAGTTLILTLYTYPYVFITTRASLLSFDQRLVEAARSLGTSRWEAFRRVTLPQLLPGIASGALLVALYALSDFGTPSLMRLDVFTRVIYVEYNAFGRETAALLSLQLLAITAVILAIESRVGDETDGAYVGTKSSAESDTTVSLGVWKLPALGFCASVVTLCLVVPIAILIHWLLRSPSGASRVGQAFQWSFAANSAMVSLAAAVACAVLAVPVAYLAARHRSKLAELIDRATYVGYATPGIVLGLALVFFAVWYESTSDAVSTALLGGAYAPTLYQALPLLIFAYVVRFLPQAVGATRSSVLRVDQSLTEAARSLGRTPVDAFREVTLPLIAPGVIAGAALVFLTTMKELPATLLLHPTGFETLVTYIWSVRAVGDYGQAAVPALALIVVSAFSMVVILSQE